METAWGPFHHAAVQTYKKDLLQGFCVLSLPFCQTLCVYKQIPVTRQDINSLSCMIFSANEKRCMVSLDWTGGHRFGNLTRTTDTVETIPDYLIARTARIQ